MPNRNRDGATTSVRVSASGVALLKKITDSIHRIETGKVQSQDRSWLEGIFNKAVRGYEQRMREKLREVLGSCGIDYEVTIRPKNSLPEFHKLTLGQIARCFQHATAYASPEDLSRHLRSGCDYRVFCASVTRINAVWVECIKHGEGTFDESKATTQLKNMATSLGDANIP